MGLTSFDFDQTITLVEKKIETTENGRQITKSLSLRGGEASKKALLGKFPDIFRDFFDEFDHEIAGF
jgi:hypothetical protein